MSKLNIGLMVVVVAVCGLSAAYGEVIWSSTDNRADPNDSVPQGFGYPSEIYSASASVAENGEIEIVINTNVDVDGYGSDDYPILRDSYSYTLVDRFNVGDLYIAYTTDGDYWNPSSGGGSIFAIAVTEHSGNIVPQAYDSGPWDPVVQGGIYAAANNVLTDFATGTYEGYEHGVNAVPADMGDGIAEIGLRPIVYATDADYVNHNTYPTVIRDYDEAQGNNGLLGMASTVEWVLADSAGGTNGPGTWDLRISFDPATLGVITEEEDLADLNFFWAAGECGNDGVLLTGSVGGAVVIPEPVTIAMIGTIVVGAVAYNRRKRQGKDIFAS